MRRAKQKMPQIFWGIPVFIHLCTCTARKEGERHKENGPLHCGVATCRTVGQWWPGYAYLGELLRYLCSRG